MTRGDHLGRTAMALLLAAAVLGAGCSGSGDGPPSEGLDPTDVQEAPTAFLAPANWTEGRWWTYTTTSPDGAGDDMDLAVTAVSADAYTLDTSSRQTAGFEAEFDISFIGPIRVSDLAGRQGDDVVEYFRFPLEEGKNWTTPWDGVERTVRIVSVSERTVELAAEEDGVVMVEYSYSLDAGFFGRMVFFDAAGEATFGNQLKDFGGNYSEPLVRATVEELWNEGDDTGSGGSMGPFGVAADTHELVIRYAADCLNATNGHWGFMATPTGSQAPQQDGFEQHGLCSEPVAGEEVIDAPVAGNWWAAVELFTVPTDEAIFSMQIVARTFQEVPAPA
jgi:hypothetical protein